MSKCKEFRLMASRYIDYDLNKSEISKLKNHLLSCDNCRRVLCTYRKIEVLVRECETFTVHDSVKSRAGSRKLKIYPVKWSIGFTAACALLMIVTNTFFSYNKHVKRTAPIVIGCSESRPIMNSPLGAMVYYEKLAGKTVHTQFVNINSESKDVYNSATLGSSDLNRALSYESPLFLEYTVASYHDKLLTGL